MVDPDEHTPSRPLVRRHLRSEEEKSGRKEERESCKQEQIRTHQGLELLPPVVRRPAPLSPPPATTAAPSVAAGPGTVCGCRSEYREEGITWRFLAAENVCYWGQDGCNGGIAKEAKISSFFLDQCRIRRKIKQE